MTTQRIVDFRDRVGEQKVSITFGGVEIRLGITEFKNIMHAAGYARDEGTFGSDVIYRGDPELRRLTQDIAKLTDILCSIDKPPEGSLEAMQKLLKETGSPCSRIHITKDQRVRPLQKPWQQLTPC